MIKYQIGAENYEFQVKYKKSFTTQEIINFYNTEVTWYNRETIYETTIKEDAEKFFEEYKEKCSTRYYGKTFTNQWLCIAEVITLEENEYDEDDEFFQGCYIDQYAEPITIEE